MKYGGLRTLRKFIFLFPLILGIPISFLGFIFHDGRFILAGLSIILGFLIKFTDQLIDEEEFRKWRKWALFTSIFIISVIGYLAYQFPPAFGLVMGCGIGLLLSGKVDHPAFVLSLIGIFVMAASLVFVFDFKIEKEVFYLIPMAALGSFFDEFFHERWKNFASRHRFILKTTAFVAFLLSFAEFYHFAAFLCFDVAYDLVGYGFKSNS